MSRTLTEIYNEAVKARNERLELTEYNNNSKMSVINAFTWTVAAAIHSFESLMDAFCTDLAAVFSSRINGTPDFYANAMKRWQYGDSLVVNEAGTSFSYPSVDTTKQLISHVSYELTYVEEYKDDVLVLKVAKGEGSAMSRLEDEELIAARAYLNQIKFAGVKCRVVSRKGDVLVPKVTVYYDGAVSKEELYDLIDESLTKFVEGTAFDSTLYAQRVVDAIQRTEHVTDVWINPEAAADQGIFVAQYDDNNELGELTKVDRKLHLSSGYIKQSTKEGAEEELPTFREAIAVELETERA